MSSTNFPNLALRVIRALALVVILISGYLIYQKSQGAISSLAGCGGEGGCAEILGGRWSAWFKIPVTVFAAALYAAVFVVALPGVARDRPELTGFILRAGAVLAAGAAVWFFGILLFVEKEFCPYCTATHLCGLAFAAIVFGPARRSLPAGSSATPYAAGVLGVVALAVGQLAGPQLDTHELGTVPDMKPNPASPDPGSPEPSPQPPRPGGLSFADGQIRLWRDEVPSVGPAGAKHHILEIFDYTCNSCRRMHIHFNALREAQPEAIAILYLPCPLNRACNPFLPDAVRDHDYACELARISLAVWKANPEMFYTFHDYLMRTPLPIIPGDAEAKAISLVGQEAFREAKRSPAIEGLLSETFGYYGQLAIQSPVMPQLLLGGKAVVRGTARDAETFVELITKHFGLE